MQRTIKFRAWLRYEKEMSEVLVLDNQEEKVFVVRKDGAAGWRMFAEVELVQYTGLKDKNGIEIYEGDIILVNVFMSKHVTGLVAFDRGSFCVTGNFEGWGYDCNTTNFWEMSTNGNEYKVIGNIYENPKLAK